MREKSEFNREWINKNSVEVLKEYSGGITLRQLYYRLVARGMINNIKHYKKVVAAMTEARWEGIVNFGAFVDRERSMEGTTAAEEKDVNEEIDDAKRNIKAWMEQYHLDRWSNQPYFIEVWIEKKALQGVFESPCFASRVALAPCKGYPSLTFLNDAKERFEIAELDGKEIKILYFGDYDPSGEDIPNSIKDNLERMGCNIEIERIALNPTQIQALKLPGVPPKATDTRTANWGGGEVVELDAIEPRLLKEMCRSAIAEYFDEDLHKELLEREEKEKVTYRLSIKEFINKLGED